jgi:hypothetical protein
MSGRKKGRQSTATGASSSLRNATQTTNAVTSRPVEVQPATSTTTSSSSSIIAHELDMTSGADVGNRVSFISRIPWASLSVFVIVLSIYSQTAYRTVTGGDSGELIITSCNMGTAHPPGYPTFTMIGRLFIDLLPWGKPAW